MKEFEEAIVTVLFGLIAVAVWGFAVMLQMAGN